MSQWSSVCSHAHTDYGLASSLKIVQYSVNGNPARPCVHVAMVTVHSVGTPNVTKLRELERKHPSALSVKIYDPEDEVNMKTVVEDISRAAGGSGVNLLYTCPDWCEEDGDSKLEDVTEATLKRTFHHNCVVPVILTKLFYPALQVASSANSSQPLNRRRAAVTHLISEAGVLGDHFAWTRGQMYAYSASLSAMVMSMKTMSYEFSKRGDGILCFAVITDTPHVTMTTEYDVSRSRDCISKVVHEADGESQGKCLHFLDGKDVSY